MISGVTVVGPEGIGCEEMDPVYPLLVSLHVHLSREACQFWFVPASVNIFVLRESFLLCQVPSSDSSTGR